MQISMLSTSLMSVKSSVNTSAVLQPRSVLHFGETSGPWPPPSADQIVQSDSDSLSDVQSGRRDLPKTLLAVVSVLAGLGAIIFATNRVFDKPIKGSLAPIVAISPLSAEDCFALTKPSDSPLPVHANSEASSEAVVTCILDPRATLSNPRRLYMLAESIRTAPDYLRLTRTANINPVMRMMPNDQGGDAARQAFGVWSGTPDAETTANLYEYLLFLANDDPALQNAIEQSLSLIILPPTE